MKRKVALGALMCVLALPLGVMAQHGLDLSGRRGNFDEVRLRSGFSPATREVRGRTGGAVDASELGEGCEGWIARRPDHIVHLRSTFDHLRLFAASDADTALVVRTPDNRWLCGKDGNGDDGQVTEDDWQAGRYLVWVGGPAEGEAAAYTLSFTEAPAE